MRERRWLLLTLYGILLATAVSGALKATRPKFKIATTTTTTTTEEPQSEDNEDEVEGTTAANEGNGTIGRTLTGIPQIDYIWDPNLPRELNGYNLSEYPFYNSMPENITFKCDGLHDGFYASVPHKCQVYHHCLYGTRYDFLCANFTAFDQKTFICQFVSEVDCTNSKKYWHRNDALYQATTTTTSSTTTTTTPAPTTESSGRAAPRDREPGRRRRPFRRRPAYDYYDEYYDEEYDRGRPRGYDRRDYDDYEDRKYRRDRDRDRDFRDRDIPRPRDPDRRDDRERETSPRERFPSRSNRRNPLVRDPLDDEPRIRNRDQEDSSRSKDLEDPEFDDRRSLDSRSRDTTDKRFRDDYDDKETAPTAVASNSEGLIKPAAPISSLYSRPRAPPKIRRPVPLSEQDKYAYKVASTPATVEERRRPDPLIMDDYEDDLEDIRPRRPLRRRPFRERDRDIYERDRDLDRPYRTRYRDEEDDLRQRKHPRDRFYDRERSRDRSLDRGKTDRERDRTGGRSQDSDRPARPFNRERESDRFKPRAKDPQEPIETTPRPNFFNRTSTTTTTTTSTTTSPPIDYEYKSTEETTKDLPQKYWRPTQKTEVPESDDYEPEYYDEEEPTTTPSPRTAIRIVKRPFLPSRGGNPNPRGLSPVGSKAPGKEDHKDLEDKPPYNAYKVIQTDKRPEEEPKRPNQPAQRRPEERLQDPKDKTPNWSLNYQSETSSGSSRNSGRVIPVTEAPNYYKDIQDQPTGPGNYRAKQRLNEVTRLQDIPESEYDVTLNEALTPTLSQEANLPSGFVLPLHRQLGRDTILQPSENSYKFSRPVQQQKSFVPSPPFLPPAPIARSSSERPKTLYYRTPETIQVSGNQYRQQRGPWHDYTGY